MLPAKPETCNYFKNILSRCLHIGCSLPICIFTIFFTGQLNVLAYLFSFLFFTGQLNVLAYHHHFFTGQLNVLACHDYSQMDLIGFCHSLSHMLGKYFLRC